MNPEEIIALLKTDYETKDWIVEHTDNTLVINGQRSSAIPRIGKWLVENGWQFYDFVSHDSGNLGSFELVFKRKLR